MTGAGGRLKTRVWARSHSGSRITTTHKYGFDDTPTGNQHGDLTDVTYSDGTPGYIQTHDRRGRLATTVRGGITTTHAWNDADLPLGEAHVGGTLNTLAVERAYFAAADTHALKLHALTVKKGGVAQRTATHAYDTAGRLGGVTADTGAAATYGYLPDSPLWQTLTFKQGATTRLTTTRAFDRLNRLQTISSSSSSSSSQPVGVGYLYNDANQRVRATEADGSHWVYEYDALGQVKGGRKYWPDGTPVAGQQFTYAHDDIGNRTATGAGGNEAGAALRPASYTRNRLNQYTARTVPAAVDVLGVAGSGSAVTVNSQSAYRRGEYFWKELGVANGSAPGATSVTVGAGGTPTTGKLVTPPASQAFVHDLDGNLTDDGVWTYTWDAENRLVGMQHKTTLADTAARRKLAFEYDARGRRIRKQVFPWSGGGYSATATSDQRFVYDGWNVLAIFDPQFSILQSFVWGLDLSGTPQGAGGVGGLLAAITGTAAQFAAYDGNGNVRALADGSTGAWSAQYEYGPFGELIRATGPQAQANPFRFSTKWHDDESDLLYYGYRWYQPGTGRWISRDPIEERGGSNIGAFVNNGAINFIDPDGRVMFIFKPCGKLGRRAAFPDWATPWVGPEGGSFLDALSFAGLPHYFIEFSDGSVNDHPGTSIDTTHWSVIRTRILIPKCNSCSEFQRCISSSWPSRYDYCAITSNCKQAATSLIRRCGGLVEMGFFFTQDFNFLPTYRFLIP